MRNDAQPGESFELPPGNDFQPHKLSMQMTKSIIENNAPASSRETGNHPNISPEDVEKIQFYAGGPPPGLNYNSHQRHLAWIAKQLGTSEWETMSLAIDALESRFRKRLRRTFTREEFIAEHSRGDR
jgi:hypothetical protein